MPEKQCSHGREALLLIIGCSKDDIGSPFIVGGFNEEYLNQLPLEDADAEVLAVKTKWTYDPSEYDWREMRVFVASDALDRAFDRVEVDGEVEA